MQRLLHDLTDGDRDRIEQLRASIVEAIDGADDPGAVLGGCLPLYFEILFDQGPDQHQPFFDCLDVMLTVYAVQYRRFDIIQSIRDISARVATNCDAYVIASGN